MSSLLKEHQFNGFCNILKISGQPMNNPDRKVIEKAFRKLALKTHPDKVMNFYLFLNMHFFQIGHIFPLGGSTELLLNMRDRTPI